MNDFLNDLPISLVTAETPYIGVFHGLIGVFLFRFRNTNRDWINMISLATIGIFVIEILFLKINETTGLMIWGISGLALLFAYGNRFKNKTDKGVIEFLKLIAIGLVACYPINFYSWTWHQNNWDILIALGYLIVPVSGTIYIYDRWILKPEKMKKKFVITLIIQSVFILVAMIYAYVQKGVADENLREAIEQRDEALIQKRQADELRVKLENCR